MTAIANLPDLRPSLLLDFANSGRVDPRIQCTRASTATCFGPDGKLRTVAPNVPRIDYDPATGKCLGLLVEEARTNFAKNSESTGAPAVWTLNTASGQGEMVDEGAHTRISCTQGVVSVRFAIHVHDDLRTDKNVAFSVEVKAATGAKLVHIQRNGYANSYVRIFYNFEDFSTSSNASGEAVRTEFGAKAMSDGWTRLSIAGSVRTTEIALNQDFVLGEIRAGESVLVRRVQIEAGAFPTSYIPTEASAVTRPADLVNLGYTLPTVGAIVSSVAAVPSTNSSNAYMWSAINPANQGADHAYLLHNGGAGTTSFWVRKGNVDQAGTSVAGLRLNAGLTYDTGAKTAAIASDSLLGQDTAARPREFPDNLTSLLLGQSRVGSSFLNGCLSRLTVYSGRVTNAQLQRLTA